MAEAFLSSLGKGFAGPVGVSKSQVVGTKCATVEEMQRNISETIARDCTLTRAKRMALMLRFDEDAAFTLGKAEMREALRGQEDEDTILQAVGMQRVVEVLEVVGGEDGEGMRMVVAHLAGRVGMADGSRWVMKRGKEGHDGWEFEYVCTGGMECWEMEVAKLEEKPTLAECTTKPKLLIIGNRPAYDCAGHLSITFSKSHKAIIVKYRHTPLHRTLDELLAYITPAPAAPLPTTSTGRRKRAATNAVGLDGQPLPEGTQPVKRPRKQRQSAIAAAAPELEEVITPQIDPVEALRQKEVATALLVEAGIDPATLSSDQFNILANQSPQLQAESINMLKQYGAERLRIIYPSNEETPAPPPTETPKVKKRGPRKSKVQALSEETVPADADIDSTPSVKGPPAEVPQEPPMVPIATMDLLIVAPMVPIEPSITSTPIPPLDPVPTKRAIHNRCNECRVRRARCTYELTGCSRCIRYGRICTYTSTSIRGGRRKGQETSRDRNGDQQADESQIKDASVFPGVEPDMQGSIEVQMHQATEIDESALYELSAQHNMDFMSTESAIELAQHAMAVAPPTTFPESTYPESPRPTETPVPVPQIPHSPAPPHMKSPNQKHQWKSSGSRQNKVNDIMQGPPQPVQPPPHVPAAAQQRMDAEVAWARKLQAQAEEETRACAAQEAEAEEAGAARQKAIQEAAEERKRKEAQAQARVQAQAQAQAQIRAQTHSPVLGYTSMHNAQAQSSHTPTSWTHNSQYQSLQLQPASMTTQNVQRMQRQTSVNSQYNQSHTTIQQQQQQQSQQQVQSRTHPPPLSNGHNYPVHGNDVHPDKPYGYDRYTQSQTQPSYPTTYNRTTSTVAATQATTATATGKWGPGATHGLYGQPVGTFGAQPQQVQRTASPASVQVQALYSGQVQAQQSQQQQQQQQQQAQRGYEYNSGQDVHRTGGPGQLGGNGGGGGGGNAGRPAQPVQTWYSSIGSQAGEGGYNVDEAAFFEILQTTR